MDQDQSKKKNLLVVGIAEIVIVTVTILTILIILVLLKAISIPRFFPSVNLKKPSPPVTLAPGTPVEIACPVSFTLCRSAVKSNYLNQSAVLYTGKNEDKLFTMGDITSFLTSSTVLENKKAKIIYTSFIQSNKCYSATYLVPDSTRVEKVAELPQKKGTLLATLTGDTLTLNNTDFNFLLQLQVKTLSPRDTDKPDYLRCTVLNKQPKEYGNYITPNIYMFD